MSIDPKFETIKITQFLKQIFEQQQIDKVVLGLSGGLDSATSLFLLTQILPSKNIFVYHLYYYSPLTKIINKITKTADIPKRNITISTIKPMVDEFSRH